MKNFFVLAAVAWVLVGCAMQAPVSGQGADPDPSQIERNADQELKNDKIQQQERLKDFENDWDRDHFRYWENDGHEDQGILWPWPGSGLSGGPTYPGGLRWGYSQ